LIVNNFFSYHRNEKFQDQLLCDSFTFRLDKLQYCLTDIKMTCQIYFTYFIAYPDMSFISFI